MVNLCPLVYKAPIHTLDAIGTEMARPTKYNAALQKKADDYVNNHVDYGDAVPSIEGLADHIDIHRETCYQWRKDIEAFSDTFERVHKKQARLLINNGLIGDFNSAITKLMLANHGYREKTEVDNKSTDGSMTPIQTIERIIVQAEH